MLDLALRRHPRGGQGRSRRQGWIGRVRDFLHEHPESRPSLTELASAVGVHRTHLARTFRLVFGCSIGEYFRSLQVQRIAQRLGENDLPIAQLAVELGFYDQAHLTRWFRRVYGTTPLVYRRKIRKGVAED